jgi:hypothetical protein
MSEIPEGIFREEYPQPEGIFVLPMNLPVSARIRVYDRAGDLVEEKLPEEVYSRVNIPSDQRLKILDEYRETFAGINGLDPEALRIHEEISEESHSQRATP